MPVQLELLQWVISLSLILSDLSSLSTHDAAIDFRFEPPPRAGICLLVPPPLRHRYPSLGPYKPGWKSWKLFAGGPRQTRTPLSLSRDPPKTSRLFAARHCASPRVLTLVSQLLLLQPFRGLFISTSFVTWSELLPPKRRRSLFHVKLEAFSPPPLPQLPLVAHIPKFIRGHSTSPT